VGAVKFILDCLHRQHTVRHVILIREQRQVGWTPYYELKRENSFFNIGCSFGVNFPASQWEEFHSSILISSMTTTYFVGIESKKVNVSVRISGVYSCAIPG